MAWEMAGEPTPSPEGSASMGTRLVATTQVERFNTVTLPDGNTSLETALTPHASNEDQAESFGTLLQRLKVAHERELQTGLAALRAENDALKTERNNVALEQQLASMTAGSCAPLLASDCPMAPLEQPSAPGMLEPTPESPGPVEAQVPTELPTPLRLPESAVLAKEHLNTTTKESINEEEQAQLASEVCAAPRTAELSPPCQGLLTGLRGLRVRIIGARGLRSADWTFRRFAGGGSDPYCVVEVLGRPWVRFQTQVVANTTEPVWDCSAKLTDLLGSDRLVFTVYDKDVAKNDDVLGKATFEVSDLHVGGFEGDLKLAEAGDGVKAYLRIRIESIDPYKMSSRGTGGSSKGSPIPMEMSPSPEVEQFAMRPVWIAPTTPSATMHRSSAVSGSVKHVEPDEGPIVQMSKGFLRHCISPPGSPYRLAWDLVGAVLIIYDSLAIPLQVFRLPDSDYTRGSDLFTLVYWTLNMFASVFVGHIRKGVLEMRFMRILLSYFRTWFVIDLIVVVPDWIFTVQALTTVAKSKSGAENTVKLLRMVRLVRTVRLIRLLKLRWILAALNDLLSSESASIIANIVKMITMLLFINHFIACMWYVVGDARLGTGVTTWIDAHGFEGETWDYMYLTSLHWSITQFTPSSMHVQPQNSLERTFAITVVVFALVGFSYLVGSITNSLTQLRSMSEDASKQFWNLRRYLKSNQVPMTLSVRIQRYLEHAWQKQKSSVSEPPIFGLLSEQLRNELQCARSVPHMVVHPLFQHLDGISNVTLQRLAVTAISRRSMARSDRLFYPGETATHVYFVVLGQLRYVKVTDNGRELVEYVDSSEDWISEPVLWTPTWVHLGTLWAHMEAELLLVDGDKFGDIIRLNPMVFALVKGYARRFMDYVNSMKELSDISQGEEISDKLREFIEEEQANAATFATASQDMKGRRSPNRLRSKTFAWP